MKICFFCYDASKYGGVLTVQHEIMDSLKAEYEISVVSLVDHIEKNLRDNFDSHAMEKVEERLIIMRKKYHKELVLSLIHI